MKRLSLARPAPNPVALKELRGRMRGARAFVFVTLFLLVMGCYVSLLYGSMRQMAQSPGSGAPPTHVVGKSIFGTVVIIELFTITLLAPALSAGAIASERQRRTFDLLRTTLLPARSIVVGKLAASLTFLLLLVLTGLPLVGLAFLLGGVTPQEMGIATALLVMTALIFSALGLFVSSLARTTLAATVLSYIVTALTMIGLPFLAFIGMSFLSVFFRGAAPGPQPSQTVVTILFYGLGLLAATNPFLAAILTKLLLDEGYTALVFPFNPGLGVNLWIVSPWLVFVVFHALLSGVLLWLAVRFVKRKR